MQGRYSSDSPSAYMRMLIATSSSGSSKSLSSGTSKPQHKASEIVRGVFGPGATYASTDVSGAYSTTFVVSHGDSRLVSRALKVRHSLPSKVLVKVTTIPMGKREVDVMRHIRKARTVRPDCRRGKALVPARHIPVVYAYGSVGNQFVIVMEFVEGVPLSNILPTQDQKRMFERAVLSIWAAGVVHADLHFNNVIMQKKRAVIIDFGMAVVLPDRLAAKLRTKLCSPDGALDDPELKEAVLAQQRADGRSIVHFNTWALRNVAKMDRQRRSRHSRSDHSKKSIRSVRRSSPIAPSPFMAKSKHFAMMPSPFA